MPPFLQRHGRTLVLLATLLLCALHLSSLWDADPDSVSYLSIARNLAQGHLARLGTSHLLYEPTYPALLTPAFLLPGPTFLYISLIHAALSALLIAGTWYWAAAYSRERAILVSLLTATNIGLWMMHRVVRPEIAYIAATVWSAGHLARALQDPAAPRFWKHVISGGLLAALAAAFRPLPFVCVGTAAALVHLAWHKRIAWAKAFCAALLVASMSASVELAWMKLDRAYSTRRPDPLAVLNAEANWTYVDYVHDWFGGGTAKFAKQLAEGVRRETGEVGRLSVPAMRGSYAREGDWRSVVVYLYFCIFGFVVWGGVRAGRALSDPLIWMGPFYFAVFCLSKYDQGTRYLIPLVPVFWLCVYEGLAPAKIARAWVLVILAAVHLCASVVDRVAQYLAVSRENDRWTELRDLAAKLGDRRGVSEHLKVGDSRILTLSYLTDHWILRVEPRADLPPVVDFVLSPPSSPSPPHFSPTLEHAGLTLHERDPATRPTTTGPVPP